VRTRLLRRAIAGTAVLCALAAPPGAAPPAERDVKAAFLCHFPSYVEWPAGTFAAPTDPIVVGVLWEDPFGPALDALVRNRSVGGRPLVVRRLSRIEDARGVHVLYVGTADPLEVAGVLSHLEGRAILTVADGERLAERGAVVNFRLEEQKVRFDINVAAAERAGLKLSSQLLKLARIVADERARRSS
jgi:hypothetical protein